MREEIFQNFLDPAGHEAQRICRSVLDSTGVWLTKDIWWQVRNATLAERTEENVCRLVLSFPVDVGRSWDWNVTNTNTDERVKYIAVDVPWQANALAFDSTLVVQDTYVDN